MAAAALLAALQLASVGEVGLVQHENDRADNHENGKEHPGQGHPHETKDDRPTGWYQVQFARRERRQA